MNIYKKAPHRRKAYIDRNWKPAQRKPVVNAARRLWVKEYKDKYIAREREEATDRNSELDKYNLWSRKQLSLNLIKDEFDYFVNASPTNLPADTTTLNQWLNPRNRAAYPSLYRIAIDILSIPPMSAKPEHIFLGAR